MKYSLEWLKLVEVYIFAESLSFGSLVTTETTATTATTCDY